MKLLAGKDDGHSREGGSPVARSLASPSIHDAYAMLFPIERQARVLQQILIDLVIQGGMQGKYLT